MVEAAGFPVVATSSFATAAILGYDDREAAPVEEVLAAATRIVQAVSMSVTVDECGYGLAPAELVERFAATGAVGLNLEDSNPPASRRTRGSLGTASSAPGRGRRSTRWANNALVALAPGDRDGLADSPAPPA